MRQGYCFLGCPMKPMMRMQSRQACLAVNYQELFPKKMSDTKPKARMQLQFQVRRFGLRLEDQRPWLATWLERRVKAICHFRNETVMGPLSATIDPFGFLHAAHMCRSPMQTFSQSSAQHLLMKYVRPLSPCSSTSCTTQHLRDVCCFFHLRSPFLRRSRKPLIRDPSYLALEHAQPHFRPGIHTMQ